ncbi:MAG TPA: TIGR00730 family Rossman fold protein [Acidimicrobiales bacterium]|nr:TIGR00730 family Rossman fold protein [Acidimicrobiales bacterium]
MTPAGDPADLEALAAADRLLPDLLDRVGAKANRDQLTDILQTALRLARGAADRLDLKITNAALREMADAFEVFAPYRTVPKVTIFGSARTLPDDPLYAQARSAARALAESGWMVITGAGPGIMMAAQEGAGPGRSFGVNIRLPFEQGANEFIAEDPKLVEMKYFFTRKLMLMKESDGFIVLPGGFGTLDEAFELLTLVQTGKAEPAPIVLLDVHSDSYWRRWEHFVDDAVARRGLISPEDRAFYTITDDAETAAAAVLSFYRNYHSSRWVGDILVLRLKTEPTDEQAHDLSRRFADISLSGRIERSRALPVEVRSHDHEDLPRLTLMFDRRSFGRLRQLIDAINELPGAPAKGEPPR